MYSRLALAALCLCVSFIGCVKNIAGGSTETTNTATLYNPDRTPAANASIKVFAVSDTSRIPVYETTTGSDGKYSLNVGNGVYNVLAARDTLAAFQDSVIFQTTYSTLANDTLARAVALQGLLVMQPNHDPRTATVQILGTDLYSNVTSSGVFTMANLAPGRYNLRSVTTLPDYTPTYTGLTIPTTAKDTVRDTINMIYTGIPAVRSIRADYDTVWGIVKLTWDTIDYPAFNDFLIYRDNAPVITPSTMPIGNSADCSYSDTIHVTQATTVIYRVAVRAKDLSYGATYANAQVTLIQGFNFTPTNDTAAMLGVPFVLHANVSGYTGAHVSYAWDIGNKGVLVPSANPETTIVLPDTLTPDYECIIRVLVDNKMFAIDTARFATRFGWQKVANAFADSSSIGGMCPVLLGTKFITFCETYEQVGRKNKISAWQSPDGQMWSKVADSIPIPSDVYPSNPVIFNNRICMVDDSGYLWTSADAASWSKASSKPICNTVVLYQGAATPVPGTLMPPSLFVDGARLLLQQYFYTYSGSQMILSSTDAVTWDTASNYQMRGFVIDFAQVGDTLVTAGIDAFMNLWLGVKNSSSVSYFDTPTFSQSYSSSAFGNTLVPCKSKVFWQSGSNITSISSLANPRYYSCTQVPYPNQSCASCLIDASNNLYLISTAGIYKAIF